MSRSEYLNGQFCWHENGTSDEATARGFYRALIGWTPEDREMPGGGGTYTLWQVDGRDICGMYRLQGPMASIPPHWMAYVWVDDVDAVVARTTGLGGTVMGPAMDVPGVGRIAVIADPAGAGLGLFQAGEHRGAACLADAPQGAFCWDECMTRDPAGARSFYTGLFGWKAHEQDMGGHLYTMFTLGEQPVAGMMTMPKEVPAAVPSHWMSYVTVSDVDGKAGQIEKLGGRVVVPPMDVPDIGRFCTLMDPAGAAISIITLKQR